MLIIGLTGGSGSGKSYVSLIFRRYGIPVIDSDERVHLLYDNSPECVVELVGAFGESIIDKQGKVDRKSLGKIVFSDRSLLDKLNSIVHKYVIADIKSIVGSYSAAGAAAVVIDAPQLFEAKVDEMCDCIISVLSTKELRISRICERDGIDEETAEARISKQLSDEFFENRSDFIIYNNGEDVEEQVNNILAKLDII